MRLQHIVSIETCLTWPGPGRHTFGAIEIAIVWRQAERAIIVERIEVHGERGRLSRDGLRVTGGIEHHLAQAARPPDEQRAKHLSRLTAYCNRRIPGGLTPSRTSTPARRRAIYMSRTRSSPCQSRHNCSLQQFGTKARGTSHHSVRGLYLGMKSPPYACQKTLPQGESHSAQSIAYGSIKELSTRSRPVTERPVCAFLLAGSY
jgi:hypothetical protein